MIFGHFIDFGHFPIEIPIVVGKNYLHGKEWSESKNKNSSEICEQSRTTWQHAQSKIPNFVKIRITLLHQLLLNINLVGFFIKSNLAALLDNLQVIQFVSPKHVPAKLMASSTNQMATGSVKSNLPWKMVWQIFAILFCRKIHYMFMIYNHVL